MNYTSWAGAIETTPAEDHAAEMLVLLKEWRFAGECHCEWDLRRLQHPRQGGDFEKVLLGDLCRWCRTRELIEKVEGKP